VRSGTCGVVARREGLEMACDHLASIAGLAAKKGPETFICGAIRTERRLTVRKIGHVSSE